jgi:hypothetical protein
MNKSYQILLILLLFAMSSFSQVEYDISGYFVNYPVYQKSNKVLSKLLGLKKDVFLDLSRLRIRPVLYIAENSRINLEYELNTFYRNYNNGFVSFSSTQSRNQVFDMSWELTNSNHFTITHFIDRLYFKHSFEFGNLTLGRQRIAWGTGRIWNPVDLFNPINPSNFAKIEKDGADAISFKWNIGNFTDLQIVYGITEKLNNSNLAARFRSNIGEYDFSLISGWMNQKYILGADFAGNLFDAGIRSEVLHEFTDENSTSFTKAVFGIDYQFTSKLYALCEYHFNGEGKLKKENYSLTKLFNGDILNLSRNYINFSFNYLLHPLFTISASNTSNLNDESGFINLSGVYSYTESIFVTCGTQQTYGNQLSEYWYLPSSVYLKISLYY